MNSIANYIKVFPAGLRLLLPGLAFFLFSPVVSAQEKAVKQVALTAADSAVFQAKNEGWNYQVSLDSVCRYFDRYGIPGDSMGTLRLYCEVHDWLGTRYLRGGHTRKGIDCSGFVAKMYASSYGLLLQGGSASLYPLVDTVAKKDLKEGDILFFRIRKGQISHVGIYLGNNKFAHATVHGGVMVNDLDEPYYRKYFFKGGRLKASARKPI